MFNNCKEMDTYEAILLAKVYHQEGKRIIDEARTKAKDIQEFICNYTVGYTNLAFSCELALKVLIVCHNGAVKSLPRGHSLKKLYEQLRSDIQTAIQYMTVEYCNQKLINQVYTAEMFDEDLDKYSLASAGITFITSFSEALFFLINALEESMKKL